MRKLFILFAVFLVFFSIAVPCFATNEGSYGHYISPGSYTLSNPLRGPGSYLESVVTYQLLFRFDNSDVVYNQMSFTARSDTAFDLNYKNTDTGANVRANRDQVWTAESYRHIEVLDGFYIYDSVMFLWWSQNVVRTDGLYETDSVDGILTIFASVGAWLGSSFNTLQSVFWTDGSLTVVGTLSVMALSFAVILLIFNMLRSFIKFR